MNNIAIIKIGFINEPIHLFNDWYKAGKWADDNIKTEHTSYTFVKINKIKALSYKIYLYLRNLT